MFDVSDGEHDNLVNALRKYRQMSEEFFSGKDCRVDLVR